MKLSEEESCWLSRCEKRERRWLPVTRWLCLAIGIGMAVAGAMIVPHFQADDMIDGGSLLMIHLFFFGTFSSFPPMLENIHSYALSKHRYTLVTDAQ